MNPLLNAIAIIMSLVCIFAATLSIQLGQRSSISAALPVAQGSPEALLGTPVSGTSPMSGATPIAVTGSGPQAVAFPPSTLDLLPTGTDGQVAIIGQTPVINGGAMVAIRNNTGAPAGSLAVSGFITDASGGVAGVGASSRLHPSLLQPGELGIAYVQFQGVAPDGSVPQLTATSGTINTFLPIGDYRIDQLSLNGGQVLGLVSNPSDRFHAQSVVLAACVDSTGALTTAALPPLPQGLFNSGQVAPFIGPVDASCQQIIAAAGGI